MFESFLRLVPPQQRLQVRRELYRELQSITVMSRQEILNEMRKQRIKQTIDHLFSVGYTKKQVKDSIANEFNISSSRAYRYIKAVKSGTEAQGGG